MEKKKERTLVTITEKKSEIHTRFFFQNRSFDLTRFQYRCSGFIFLFRFRFLEDATV